MKIMSLMLLVCYLTVPSSPHGTPDNVSALTVLSATGMVDILLPQDALSAGDSSLLDDFWQSVLNGLQWIWNGILSIIAGITEFLTGGLKDVTQQAWDSTVGSAEKMVDDVQEHTRSAGRL